MTNATPAHAFEIGTTVLVGDDSYQIVGRFALPAGTPMYVVSDGFETRHVDEGAIA
jgi:hypothetical protein